MNKLDIKNIKLENNFGGAKNDNRTNIRSYRINESYRIK